MEAVISAVLLLALSSYVFWRIGYTAGHERGKVDGFYQGFKSAKEKLDARRVAKPARLVKTTLVEKDFHDIWIS